MADDFGLPSTIEFKDVILTGDGKSMDVTDLFFEATIYEELGEPQLHGKMMFVDMSGTLTRFGLTGQEIIQFTVKKLDYEKTLVFHLTEIESVNISNNGATTFVVAMVQNIVVLNSLELVSQAYEGTVSSIIESIYNDYLGLSLNYVDETAGNYKFIIPNWKPFQAIKWLMNRAITAEGVPLVIHNTWRNGTSIISYDTIFKRDAMEEYFPMSMPDEKASAEGNAYNYRGIMQKPTNFFIKKHGNALEQMYFGTYSHRSLNIDSTNKTADLLEYTEEYNKKPRLNDFSPVNEKKTYNGENILNQFKTKQSIAYHQGYSFGNDFESYNSDVNSITPFRNNYAHLLTTYQYDLTVHGRFDISVGSIIEITFPNNKIANELEPAEDIDNKRSGRHLVTAAAHTFRGNKYMINIECSTDGFGEEASVE